MTDTASRPEREWRPFIPYWEVLHAACAWAANAFIEALVREGWTYDVAKDGWKNPLPGDAA